MTARILRRNGYQVLEAAEAAEALALAAAHGRIDLLLTDVVMPKTSGRQLAEGLRGDRPDLPVLFMSGYARGVLGPQRALGDDVALLHKPFTEASLLHAVHETIAAGRR